MQIRCYRCGWSFAIKNDEAAFALEALEETGGTHYDSNCPRCRHSNRVSLEQLRKAVPRTVGETSPVEAAEETEVESQLEVEAGSKETEAETDREESEE